MEGNDLWYEGPLPTTVDELVEEYANVRVELAMTDEGTWPIHKTIMSRYAALLRREYLSRTAQENA